MTWRECPRPDAQFTEAHCTVAQPGNAIDAAITLASENAPLPLAAGSCTSASDRSGRSRVFRSLAWLNDCIGTEPAIWACTGHRPQSLASQPYGFTSFAALGL